MANINSITGGELRTAIMIKQAPITVSDGGFQTYDFENAVNVFGEGSVVKCKWVNAYGTQLLAASAQNLKEVATLSMRYSSKITPDCWIFRQGEDVPFDIIGIDNIGDKNRFLEIKIKRIETSG